MPAGFSACIMSYCMNMWSRLWPPEPDPSRLSPPGFQKETSHCRQIIRCFHIRLHHDQAWYPSGMLAPTLGHGGSYTYPGYPDAWGGHLQGMQGHDGPPGPNHEQDTNLLSYSQPYGMGMGRAYTTHCGFYAPSGRQACAKIDITGNACKHVMSPMHSARACQRVQ